MLKKGSRQEKKVIQQLTEIHTLQEKHIWVICIYLTYILKNPSTDALLIKSAESFAYSTEHILLMVPT